MSIREALITKFDGMLDRLSPSRTQNPRLFPPHETADNPVEIEKRTIYFQTRNIFFNSVLLPFIESNQELVPNILEGLLVDWKERTGIYIDPRHLYELANIYCGPGSNLNENRKHVELSRQARDLLKTILLQDS